MQYLKFSFRLIYRFFREAFFLFQHKQTHTRNRYRYLRGFVFHCLHKHSNTNRKTITNNKQSIQKPPCYTHTQTELQADAVKINRIKIETKKNTNTKTVYFQQQCVQLVHIQTNSPSNSRLKQGRQHRGLPGLRLFLHRQQQQQDKMDTSFQSTLAQVFSLSSFVFKCKFFVLNTTSSGRPTFGERNGIYGAYISRVSTLVQNRNRLRSSRCGSDGVPIRQNLYVSV